MNDIINDNVNAVNNSFLYYLHEENKFDEEKLITLCNCIHELNGITVIELRQLYFIQNQILRHIAYHFDPNDMSIISNLPKNYWDLIERLDYAICKLTTINI